MDQSELIELIRDAVPAGAGGRWADLGAGDGNFTVALATLLSPVARLTAIDRDANALERLATRLPAADVRVADFQQPLDLENLDGVLMANSLHFVRDKDPLLRSVRAMLKPGGRLIVVEYDAERGNPWVPHPFTYATWEKLAARAGFVETRFLHSVPSRWLNAMWSAVSRSPLSRQGGSGSG